MDRKLAIEEGKTSLGIELGSTRIKAVLIDEMHQPIASGSHDWENRLEDGVWTYHLEDVWTGIQDSLAKLMADVKKTYGTELKQLDSMGVSAMMHGYLVFDKKDQLLTPFRIWRNTMTEQAAKQLTEHFGFNIPQRWSIAHLYQAIINDEAHVKEIHSITTLAGYVHWMLTGEQVLGVGEASGMFPIGADGKFDGAKMQQFQTLIAEKNYTWNLQDILPDVKTAGETAGLLTEKGARLLDPTGALQANIPLCPPEGDAGTGMTATNSVAERTGNVSAGTSIFAMVVLEKALSKVYTEIDMVTTPTGKPVAMVHCNNCTSDLDAWVKLFREVLALSGATMSKPELYDKLYFMALEGDSDCGGVLSYNYVSGEPVTDMEEGRPLLVRMPDSNFTLANHMRSLLFSTMATLKIGMDILTEQEQVKLDQLLGHGGLFKTEGVGQRLMASALNVPVTVMESAGEGGAWGIALLAAYMRNKAENESLEAYLNTHVFNADAGVSVAPNQIDREGFMTYIERYKQALPVEKAATEYVK